MHGNDVFERAAAVALRDDRVFSDPMPPLRGCRSVGTMGDHVHGRAARLAEHEAPNAPFLVAQGIGDLEAQLHRAGMDGVNVVDSDRYTRGRRDRRC